MRPPFEITTSSIQLLAEIERLLGQYEGRHHPRPAPQLRRSLRVRTVQGSVAIEGNTLTEQQITALIEGKRFVGPQREILEVRNALTAYQLMGDWFAWVALALLILAVVQTIRLRQVEQLGLRLVSAKAPIEGVVIDHAEKPSAN